MSRLFSKRLVASAGALAVGTWLAAGPLAAQDDKPRAGGKDNPPAAAAPKADAPSAAPKADAPKADAPSAQQQAPRPSATQSQSPQRPAASAPSRPQPAPQRPQGTAPSNPDKAADRAADQAQQKTDAARDRAADQADRARDTARDAKEDARDTARDAKDTAKDTAKDARDNINDRSRDADRDRDANRTARPDADRSGEGPTRNQTNRAYSSDNDRRGDRDRGDRDRRDGDRHHRAFTKVGINVNVVNNGIAITSVVPNSVFATVGFRTGDVLVSVGGRRFNDTVVFYDWLRTVRPGERVAVVVLRGGQEQTLYWTPTEQWVQEFTTVVDEGAPAADTSNFLGIHLDPQIQDAAIVADVDPNSPAARAGVRRNDGIESVNGEQVRSPDDFAAVASKVPQGEAVEMTISRLMNVQIAPGGAPAAQTAVERQETYVNPGQAVAPGPAAVPVQPGPPAVAPAPRPQAPVAAPQPRQENRGGLFRRK